MYRIIIADDEPMIRAGLYYRNDWEAMGFEVAALLEDGSDVLEYLVKERVDVLLTDICMYQVSGLQAAAMIREKYPWMKVVLLSGYKEFEYAREAMRLHVYEYLLKPIDYDNLRSVFEKIKRELDEANHEEQLLRSFGEEEYEKVLELTKAVAGSVVGEGEETWLAYARLKPMMRSTPVKVKEILVKRLLEQLQSKLAGKAPELAERFETRLKTLDLSGSSDHEGDDKTGGRPDAQDGKAAKQPLIELLSQLNDELVSGNLVTAEKKAAVDDSISKACNYISNHLGDDFTYRDVAEFVHLSPRHFIRRFRSEMNETFTDYLIRVRMEAAVRLIEAEETDIADVPGAVGYHDEKYFQQIFKKYTGCTPREYRRRKQRG